MQRIYMDANATTPLLPEVFDAMRPFFLEHAANPSSIHQPGQFARGAIDHARDQLARLLGCRAAELVFTSGGTESDNLALFGVLAPGDHLITTQVEHHAVLHAAEALAERGIEVTFLPVDAAGLVSSASLQAALQPNTRLISILQANNETGVIQPLAALAAMAHAHRSERGVLVHTDAVQAAGKLPIDLRGGLSGTLRDVDLLSISGHKMYAPQGTGALFVRRGVRLAPMFHGGSHERQRRAGTENVAGIVALGRAAELAQAWLADGGPEALTALRDRFEQTLLARIPDSGINGTGAARTPNTANLWFDHVEAEALVIALDLKGLFVSGGSACQSGATEPSHVLTAMGLTPARARASIRFSLSRLTSAAEVDAALELIPEAVDRLRTLSPGWQKDQTDHGSRG